MRISSRFFAACRLSVLLSAGIMLAAPATIAQAPAPAPPAPPTPPTPPAAAPMAPAPSATAVTPAPGAMPAPAPQPAPVIEPEAHDLFLKMIAAHKSLHSFLALVTAVDTVNGKASPATIRARIAFQSPAKAAVTVARSNKTVAQFFSNGVTFVAVNPAQKQFIKRPLPAQAAGPIVAAQVGRIGLLPQSLTSPDFLNGLLTAPMLASLVKSPASDPVEGTAVDTLVATLSDPSGKTGTFTFFLGQSDHVLRRVLIAQSVTPPAGGAANAITHTETLTSLQSNPTLPASTFTYTPPASYKSMSSSAK